MGTPAPKTALSRWAARAPVATFLVGTFGWAWLLWGYWIPAMPPGGLEISPPFILSALAGGLAPSLSALAVAWLAGGRQGIGALLASFTRWTIAPGWYALALLTAPAIAAVAAIVQGGVVGPLRWPDPGIVAMAVIWPLMAAFGEEIGWRGFLQARLGDRLGALGGALVVGLLWGLWHLPSDWIGLKAYGEWFFAIFLVNGPIGLTAHAVIMAWLWRRTGSSLPIAILYHFGITASAMLTPVAGEAGPSGVLAAAIGAGLAWAVALGLLAIRRRDFRTGLVAR